MTARVAAKLAAGLKPVGAVNPLHYRAMLRFFEMDREDATFTGLVWDVGTHHKRRGAQAVGRVHGYREQGSTFAWSRLIFDFFPIQHFGTLHGGCSATMVDCLTCAALIVATGRPAVSVNLNMSYMNPAPLGTLVRIDAQVVKIGNSLAYTKADLIGVKKDGVEIEIASAKHTLAFSKRVYVRERTERHFNIS